MRYSKTTRLSIRCKPGNRQSDNWCVPVVIPTNATLDYSGHGWMCQAGYHQSGNSCGPVTAPTNATLDYSGHGWMCQTDYHQSGNACIASNSEKFKR